MNKFFITENMDVLLRIVPGYKEWYKRKYPTPFRFGDCERDVRHKNDIDLLFSDNNRKVERAGLDEEETFVRCARSASDSGDAWATYCLALQYLDGDGVRADEEQYRRLLHKAYCQNYLGCYCGEFISEIRYRLWKCYEEGMGAPASSILAAYWKPERDSWWRINTDIFLRDKLCLDIVKGWCEGDISSWKSIPLRLKKAEREGSIMAKAILGKLNYCAPAMFQPFTPIARMSWRYNNWLDMEDEAARQSLQKRGLLRLEEAADRGDVSARYTLSRIRENDDSVFCMSSPFEP